MLFDRTSQHSRWFQICAGSKEVEHAVRGCARISSRLSSAGHSDQSLGAVYFMEPRGEASAERTPRVCALARIIAPASRRLLIKALS